MIHLMKMNFKDKKFNTDKDVSAWVKKKLCFPLNNESIT